MNPLSLATRWYDARAHAGKSVRIAWYLMQLARVLDKLMQAKTLPPLKQEDNPFAWYQPEDYK